MLTMSSKANAYYITIIEVGYIFFFAASLVPPITTESNDLYEAWAIVAIIVLLGGIFHVIKKHEWVFDLISAILFGVAVQLVLTSAPVEQSVQVFGLALVTAGIARGVGLHVDPVSVVSRREP